MCCEANRTEGEKRQEAGEGETVEVEAQPSKLQVCQEIDDAYALLLRQYKDW
jgi:hypothetical protein